MPLKKALTFLRPSTLGFDTLDELNALKRRPLQALAKRNGVRANMKSVAIVEALTELFEAEQARLNEEAERQALAASGVDEEEVGSLDVSQVTEKSFVSVSGEDLQSSPAPVDAADVAVQFGRVDSDGEEASAAPAPAEAETNVEAAAEAEDEVEAEAGVEAEAAVETVADAEGDMEVDVEPTAVVAAVDDDGDVDMAPDAETAEVPAPGPTPAPAAKAAPVPRSAKKQKSAVTRPASTARSAKKGKSATKKKSKVRDWNKIHSKLFATQESISSHLDKRRGKTPGKKAKRPAAATTRLGTPMLSKPATAASGASASKKSAGARSSGKAGIAPASGRKRTPVAALARKPFQPKKSSKKPTAARGFQLGVRRTPSANTPAGVGAAAGAGAGAGAGGGRPLPRSAGPTPAATRIPMPKRRRPTPHPFGKAAKAAKTAKTAHSGKAASKAATPASVAGVRAPRPSSAASRKSVAGSGIKYRPHKGRVQEFAGESMFSPKRPARKPKKFDLQASLKRGNPHVKGVKSVLAETTATNKSKLPRPADKNAARAKAYKAHTGMNGTKGRAAAAGARAHDKRKAALAKKRAAGRPISAAVATAVPVTFA